MMMRSLFFLTVLVSVCLSCDLEESVASFRQKQHLNPHPEYVADPYQNTDPAYKAAVQEALTNKVQVCALKYQDETKTKYTLRNFASQAEAEAANFIVTHQGVCGACSTLQDLTVYLTTDLTRPVRACGVNNPFSEKALSQCIKDLGFTDQCTQIWTFNTLFTKKNCYSICMMSYLKKEPFVLPNGQLNKCLQCDEDVSGPIFKYESGRTRRNSGIKSEIDRPADQIFNVTHCYY